MQLYGGECAAGGGFHCVITYFLAPPCTLVRKIRLIVDKLNVDIMALYGLKFDPLYFSP
jgi:hypothetical protein